MVMEMAHSGQSCVKETNRNIKEGENKHEGPTDIRINNKKVETYRNIKEMNSSKTQRLKYHV
jgi:hypothetical protein